VLLPFKAVAMNKLIFQKVNRNVQPVDIYTHVTNWYWR